MTGCKLACGEGGCGACTVMVSALSYSKKEIKYPRLMIIYIFINNILQYFMCIYININIFCYVPRHYSVNSCITPILSLHGLAVTTVEGIGNVKNGVHPVQERIAKAHGVQCGYCTPGFVMSMYTLLKNVSKPSKAQIEENFHGNLCRCTGYRSILSGCYSFCQEEKVKSK